MSDTITKFKSTFNLVLGMVGRSNGVDRLYIYTANKGLVINYLRHPLRRAYNFLRPPFKQWKLFVPPYNMAKTSSYHIKATPELFVPKLCPPPFQEGQNFTCPSSHFKAPPPSP